MQSSRSPLGRFCTSEGLLRALSCARSSNRCGVRSGHVVRTQLIGGQRNGAHRRFEQVLLIVEKLLDIIGADLGAVRLLLTRVAASLAVLDLRLAAFNARRRGRAQSLGDRQLRV
ncbi:MAG TPA: hypothetical protein VN804_01350, partial [Solirubrobacteraceae bacterium]|nr:hypothetical protein [Solirubrobacteraceae bacterium]